MPRPQFSLFSILILLTVACAICAWLATGSFQQPRNPDASILYTVAVPPASGLISATIAVSLTLVGVTWVLLLFADANRRILIAARIAWTLGFASYVAHVAAAFATYHGWSHAKAAWHTGFRTWEVTGWFWPGGIWVNYFFTLVWACDVIYWWAGQQRYASRPAWLRWFVHSFFAFMIFQAGVVFASGVTRWATLAGLAIVALVGVVKWSRCGHAAYVGQVDRQNESDLKS